MTLENQPVPKNGTMAQGTIAGLIAGIAFGLGGYALIAHKMTVFLPMCFVQFAFVVIGSIAIVWVKGSKTFWGFVLATILTDLFVLPVWMMTDFSTNFQF